MKFKFLLGFALVLGGISANAADTHSLRVLVIPAQTAVRVNEPFKVALRVENPTATNQTVRVMNCSWLEEWKTSNPNISWLGWGCTKNFAVNIEIPPGGAYTNELTMLIPHPIAERALLFRMGFTPIDSSQTFWSDDVKLDIAKDFDAKEIEAIWPELWQPNAPPKIEPLSELQVMAALLGSWDVDFFGPDKTVISVKADHQVSVGGIKNGKAWEKHGEWKVIAGKLVLSVPADSMPSFIFRQDGTVYIFDPWAKGMMAELRRPTVLPSLLTNDVPAVDSKTNVK